MPNTDKREAVLLIDDDKILCEMIQAALADDYSVHAVHRAADALHRLDGHAELPSLILLDIDLQNDSGYDLCETIKTSLMTRHIPIIMVSSLSGSFDKVKAIEIGAVDYVSKPVDPSVLKMRIKTHITINRLQSGLEETVRERTEELHVANETLRAMLDLHDAEKNAIRRDIHYRIEKYIKPYLKRLEPKLPDPEAKSYLQIILSNFDQLVTPNGNSLSAAYAKLTPAEVRVADLIRQGKRTKEIAHELKLSEKSVYFYRNQIRTKLGLRNSKQNLVTYLSSHSTR